MRQIVLGILGAGVLSLLSAAAAQDGIASKPIASRAIAITSFTDSQIAEFLATLGAKFEAEKDPRKQHASWSMHLWRFQNRLDRGTMSAAQEARIVAFLDELAANKPRAAELLARTREGVTQRRIGVPAPEISGKDLDGVPFKLSDYRGNVIALYFSGDWCGPCRGEYPYQRRMLEIFKGEPFVVLAVSSDSLAAAKKAKAEHHLPYRTWWDGHQKEPTRGPIATAWNITGWPTIYVIDRAGIIRFVNLRNEDVITAAKQLLRETPPSDSL